MMERTNVRTVRLVMPRGQVAVPSQMLPGLVGAWEELRE